MTIGIIAAMSAEYAQIAALLNPTEECRQGPFHYVTGRLNSNDIVLMQCGIGKVNAAAGAAEIIRDQHPDALISTGVAGGIDASLNVMDVVVSTQLTYHDVWCGEGNKPGQVQGLPAVFESNRTLVDCALNLNTDTHIHGGLICTGDRFITSRAELDAIKHDFPQGLAVDMESAAIAQVCYLYSTPFVSFRIISDTPGADLHQQQYENFWQSMADRSFATTRAFLRALPNQL